MFKHTDDLLARLDGVVTSANGWEARCPCRQDDRNPSLSVHENDDGQVLMHCHRNGGCGTEDILDAIGLKVTDLFDKDPQKAAGREYPKIEQKKLKFVEAYDYQDADGALLFQKVRFSEPDGKKTFRQRKPDGKGGWDYKLGDTPKVLYNLPRVLAEKEAERPIWVVEGEKDCDTLNRLGACATTMPGGAGKWLDIHTRALAGATVDIIVDNDEPGKRHAADVEIKLREAGCDVAVWICPEEKDITDHIAAGGTTEQLVEYKLEDYGDQPLPEIEEVEEEPLSPVDDTLSQLRGLLDDTTRTPASIMHKAALLLGTAEDTPDANQGRLVMWEDFVAEDEDDSYDWLIPGLLERRERVIVVAAEGVGKTMLLRQAAILPAMGVQPFSFQPMPPIRTLSVDLENPERIIRRTSRNIIGAAKSMGFEPNMDAHLYMKPDGFDLMKMPDRLLLESKIEEVKPDLLLLGPLYKSFIDPGGRTSEAIATEVAKYLDTLRAIYGVALWLEHHAPLGTGTSRDLRPFGSAVWSRWPEFGIALTPDPTVMGEYVYQVAHFRGARDERHWPATMKRGVKFPFETLDWMTP